ncbi:hypothetical protein N665_0071s0025 [Sinapis alba]|nr:hypothetical protein N665_0071s0025 [Sinapis alba]
MLTRVRRIPDDFQFDEEIDPDKEQRFSVKKNQKWENHLPTRSSFKSVRKIVLQTGPPAGFSFLIPASHQRSWTLHVGYACVYESWFNNCRIWWPLPECMTTYCSRRKIALGQYTANGIRIMLTTLSITAKIGFFYGKMVPKYNVITWKPSKVNFWNRLYFYMKINETSLKILISSQKVGSRRFRFLPRVTRSYQDVKSPALALYQRGPSRLEQNYSSRDSFFENSHIDNGQTQPRLPSFLCRVDRHPFHGQEGSSGGGRPAKWRRVSHPDEGAPNVSPRPSPPPEVLVGEHLIDEVGSREPSSERNSPLEPVDETEMVVATEEPTSRKSST